MRGLLSRIASADPSRPLEEVASIVDNLRSLLGTRLGSAPSAEDFGMIDLADVVHAFPEAGRQLTRSIRDTIRQYEPRLRSVRVKLLESEDPLVLVMEVSARLASNPSQGLLRVTTRVLPGGWTLVD